MSRSLRFSLACLGLPIALAFSSCGDGLDLVPITGSTSGGPTPTPRPGATATPTPAPTPTPTPTPATALTCQLPDRPNCTASGCCTEHGGNSYVTVIDNAQTDLEKTRPDIFNPNGSLKVDEIEYTEILAARITAMTGICTIGGGRGRATSKDEIGLKRDNNQSTNVDVIIGSSHSPAILGVYNCRPASF